MSFLPSVHFDDVLRVDWKILVRIYDYTEESRIGLEEKQNTVLKKQNKTKPECIPQPETVQ